MFKKLKFFLCFSGCLFISGYALAADKLFLKDGRVIEGWLVAKSETRYVMSIETGGEPIALSFFVEDVDRTELDKKTVDRQIPYLKEVDSLKVPVTDKGQVDKTVYELSLYKKGQLEGDQAFFTQEEIRNVLREDEFKYYEEFNKMTNRHADRLVAIDNLYQNLPSATPEDFVNAKKTIDQINFELEHLPAPPLFKDSRQAYIQFLQATIAVFDALEHGQLDEASRQMKAADQAKQRSQMMFRKGIMDRKGQAAQKTAPVSQKKETKV